MLPELCFALPTLQHSKSTHLTTDVMNEKRFVFSTSRLVTVKYEITPKEKKKKKSLIVSNNSGAIKFPQNQWSLISNEVLYFERNDTSALKRLFRCYTLAVNAKHQWPLRFRCWSPCTLCLVSPPSALIHNRSSSACCFGDFSSLDDGRRPRAIVAWLWTAELYTIKGINYNQPCNGAFCIV